MPTELEIETLTGLWKTAQAALTAKNNGQRAQENASSAKYAAKSSLDAASTRGATDEELETLMAQSVAAEVDFLAKETAIVALWDTYNTANGIYETALNALVNPS